MRGENIKQTAIYALRRFSSFSPLDKQTLLLTWQCCCRCSFLYYRLLTLQKWLSRKLLLYWNLPFLRPRTKFGIEFDSVCGYYKVRSLKMASRTLTSIRHRNSMDQDRETFEKNQVCVWTSFL